MTYFLFFGYISILSFVLRSIKLQNSMGVVLGVLLATFAALRGPDVAADFLVYQNWYAIRDLSNGYLERPGLFEAVYFFLNDFFNAFDIPFRIFIWFLAFTAVYIKTIIIASFSKNNVAFGVAILIYASTFYLLHDFTQIRVGLAIAIIFLAFHALVRGRCIHFLLFVFLAAGFHSSALMGFLLLMPFRGRVADWVDRCLIFIAVGSVLFAPYGVTFSLMLVDLFSTFDPRVALYISASMSGESEVVDPFALRAMLLLVLALTLAVVKVNAKAAFRIDDKDIHAIILVRRSILIGISCLFLISPIPELAVRLFEINIALLPILAATIFSCRGWLLQKAIVVIWGGSIFYVFVFLDGGLVKPYELFFA